MRNLYFMSIVFDKLYLYYELIVFVIHTNTMDQIYCVSIKKGERFVFYVTCI